MAAYRERVEGKTPCYDAAAFRDNLGEGLVPQPPATARAPRALQHVLLGAAVCALLAVIYLTSLDPAGGPPAGVHAPHRYSSYDPAWTQMAFPRLGTPIGPASSATAILTRPLLPHTDSDVAWRLAVLPAIAQVVALALFWLVAREIGVPPGASAVATIALGMEPAFFDVATQWTPYAALPALMLGAVLARLRWTAARARRWHVTLLVLSFAVVAEAVAAIPIVLVLLWTPRDGRAGTRPGFASALWLTIAIVSAGLAVQVLGAAAAWHAAVSMGGGPAVTWRDALVAATSRWGRLLDLYVIAPMPDAPHRLRQTIGELGLLAPMLAIVGLIAMFRTSRRTARLLLVVATLALALDVGVQAPVAVVSPALLLLIVVVFLAAAAGLADVSQTVRAPAVALMCFGAILAGDGLAARRLSALDKSAHPSAAAEAVVHGLPSHSSIVASNVELDRRLTAANASPSGVPIVRIPQTEGAIRQTLGREGMLFVWPEDMPRVSALGWMLAPAARGAASTPSIYEVIAPTPCVQVEGRNGIDLAAPLASGSIALQAERGSAYQIEIEGDGLPDHVMAIDVVNERSIPVAHPDSAHLLLAIESARRGLPRIDFPAAPDRARARLLSDDSAQRVRVCGAPARGQAMRLFRAGDAVVVPVDRAAIFERGWHPAEPVGDNRAQRWSDGPAGLIVLQLPGEPSPLEIVVEALPAAPASRAPALTIDVNGRALPAQAMLAGARPYTWIVPRDAVRRGLNILRLSVPEAFTPRALGVSEDGRLLGFEVSDVRIRRLE